MPIGCAGINRLERRRCSESAKLSEAVDADTMERTEPAQTSDQQT